MVAKLACQAGRGYCLAGLALFFLVGCKSDVRHSEAYSIHSMQFGGLASTWDEGLPLGNGKMGALVWQNEDRLRLSLDHTNLWDLRPVENLSKPEFSFAWVRKQLEEGTYEKVHAMFDIPYDRMPAPSKIPGAALEFPVKNATQSTLFTDRAEAVVTFDNGIELKAFVHAEKNMGWFRFSGVDESFKPLLIPPAYAQGENAEDGNSLTGQELSRLGYPKGIVSEHLNEITYQQSGYGDFEYLVGVVWRYEEGSVEGAWVIATTLDGGEDPLSVFKSFKRNFESTSYQEAILRHTEWWRSYWTSSRINVPDTVIQRQYDYEMYKFGSAARSEGPPISLQAVWTADNGKLPPWKGDFHHDLNTQLSYWPAYAGNKVELAEGFVNWLWENKGTFEEYTRTYFGTSGLNVPGVTTLKGQPMGGWIQYSFGSTVGAWLSHHFYLHWQYTADRNFLKEKAYPWLREVSVFLQEISVKEATGMRKLPISSSPEINNNSPSAWFSQTTNFDLGLIRWNLEKTAELAEELGLSEEAGQWRASLAEWPELALNSQSGGLAISPGFAYDKSHRHLSHLVAWHPLGSIDWSGGEVEQSIIGASLADLERVGSDEWVGYSFAWLGNLYARNRDGDGAAKTLRIFAENFVLPNSFHVNGEQHNKGFTNFKYRPFTLEGNFAFAAGVQEMLLQSHTGTITLFPAVPSDWQEVSFDRLRAVGGFLVSAARVGGLVQEITIEATADGTLLLDNPFAGSSFEVSGDTSLSSSDKIRQDGRITLEMKKDSWVSLKKK